MPVSARPLLAVLVALLLLAACGPDRPDPADAPARPDAPTAAPAPPGSAPPSPADLGAVQDELTDDQVPSRQAGEIIRIDPDDVLSVTVERGGQRFEVIRRPQPMVGSEPVSEAAIRTWLQRFAPLAAGDRHAELTPQAVDAQATHRLLFHFEDDSTQPLIILRQGDRLAVISQLDGPVFTLPAARLAELVPAPGALR